MMCGRLHTVLLLMVGAAQSRELLVDPAIECTAYAVEDALLMLPGLPHGSNPSQRSAWRERLGQVRAACQKGFNASVYDRPELLWTQAAFVAPQMHPFDRTFYEPTIGFTARRWLTDVRARYGGVDAILLWPTYPNIGIDARNQFDMVRSMPGGVSALRAVISELHEEGVRVLLPYNPWDTSTRREVTREGAPVDDPSALAQLAREVGADGFNGDTMAFVREQFFEAGEGLAIEPELMGLPPMRSWHTLGWAYWQLDKNATVPRVDFYKYSLDSRWMSHACQRWAKDHTTFLLTSFFNSVGFVPWENVWGSFNQVRGDTFLFFRTGRKWMACAVVSDPAHAAQMVPRDAELLKRSATILRFFGGAERGGLKLLTSSEWEPFPPELHAGEAGTAHGSRYPDAQGERQLLLLVNLGSSSDSASYQVAAAHEVGWRWWDCLRGMPLLVDAQHRVRVPVEAQGIGCIFGSAREREPEGFQAFLGRMRALSAEPLSQFSSRWSFLLQARLVSLVAVHFD